MRSWLGNNPLLHPLFGPVLLVAMILAVYYPALFSGTHPIDDPGIFSLYSVSPPLLKVLLPGSSYYYRPFVELSFWLDNLLWGMEPRTMHLESILVHCANTLLIYVLARKLSFSEGVTAVPLLTAALFAMHPLPVEAVSWIAGRTDLLLTFFVLFSLFFWLRWIVAPNWKDMLPALILFTAALLTKETGLAFAPVILLVAVVQPGSATKRQRSSVVAAMLLPVVTLLIISLVFKRGSSGLSRFLSLTDISYWQAFCDGLTATGFYAKKLFFPFPLNFAIYDVQPLYALPGIALFPLLWWAIKKDRIAGVFFVSAALCAMPAVLIAIKQVAWTSFAERYLYLPLAFFLLGISITVSKVWVCRKKYFFFAAVVVTLFFASVTLQRNILWADKLAFFQDAVAKSPRFGSVYYSLGGLLFKNGDIAKADEAFATAEQLNTRESMRYPIKAAIMGVMLAKDQYLGVKIYFNQLFRLKSDAPADFLELLYKADSKRLEQLSDKDKAMLAADLIETLALLNTKKPDPFWLYQSGRYALMADDTARATDFFQRAYRQAPVDAHYRGAAQKQLDRLHQNK